MAEREGDLSDREVAREIRRQVDQAGGTLEVGVRELRDGFGRSTLTRRARTEIADALTEVGIAADPPLDAVRLDDRVRLVALESARPPRMEESAPAASAGWFSDPEDVRLVRYWDGSSWTDHRRVASAASPIYPPRTPTLNLWRRFRVWPSWVQWSAATLLLLLVVGALLGEEPSDERSSDDGPPPAEQAVAPSDSTADREADAAVERERARERKRAKARKRARERAREKARERERRRERRREEERQRREREARPPSPAPEEEPAGDCDPSYNPCVPSYPPDLDCDEVDGPVTVTGGDPHRLDADNDGEGCEP